MGKLEDDIDATMNEILNENSDEEVIAEPETIEEPVDKVEEPVDEVDPIQAEAPIDDPAPIEEEIDPSLINPPSTWRPAAKEAWKNLSPIAREEIRKREWDATNGISQMRKEMATYEEKAQMADRMTETMQPYQAVIQSENTTPEAVVGEMLKSAYMLRTGSAQQKVQMVAQLAQQYGFANELMAAVSGQQMNYHQPQAPEQQYLTSEQARAEARAEYQKIEQERENERLANTVHSFQNAINEDGTLKYPYFENVRPYMATILETSDITLEEAYNEALWASPETRDLVLNQQRQSNESQEAANKHREQAEKAAANNLDRIPSDATEQQIRPTGSIDDTLNAVMEDIERRSA